MTEKALIIAEKMSLARLYDSAKKYRGASMPYDYDIMQLQGNVVRLKMPEEYDESWHSWDKIPVLPEKWEYTPIKAEKKDSPNMAKYHNRGYEYFKKIYEMLDTGEYAAIVNGCDPDREGQAIFDKMMTLMPAKARKLPQLRLWQDDQEVTTAIKFMTHPYDNKDPEMIALSKSAQSRGILDWLLGINGTRALTTVNNAKKPLVVGRGVTAILGIVVNRENEINNFEPQPYYQLHANLDIADNNFDASMVKKNDKDKYVIANIDNKDSADDIVKALNDAKDKTATVKVFNGSQGKHGSKKPPKYLNTTGMTRILTQKPYNYSIDDINNSLEDLYTKGITSYPRTPSTLLSDKMLPKIDKIIDVAQSFVSPVQNVKINQEAIEKLKKNKKYINIGNKSKTAHTCLTLMGKSFDFNALPKLEQDICSILAIYLICSLLPDEEHIEENAVFSIDSYDFQLKATKLIKAGWTDYFPGYNAKYDELPELEVGSQYSYSDVFCKELKTTPPAHFNVASLLNIMENIDRLYDDRKDLKDAIKKKGIGTDATRNKLIAKARDLKYWTISSKGQRLEPTKLGFAIIAALDGNSITSPDLTAEWELKLKNLADNKITTKQFINMAENTAVEMTKQILEHKDDQITKLLQSTAKNQGIADCPFCNDGQIIETDKSFHCTNNKTTYDEKTKKWSHEGCNFLIPKSFATLKKGKITKNDIKNLVKYGYTGFKDMVSKSGKDFSAMIAFKKEDGKYKFIFKFDVPTKFKCPYCQNNLAVRNGKYGEYLTCENKDMFLSTKTFGHSFTNGELKQILKGDKVKIKNLTWKSGKHGDAFFQLESGKLKMSFD